MIKQFELIADKLSETISVDISGVKQLKIEFTMPPDRWSGYGLGNIIMASFW